MTEAIARLRTHLHIVVDESSSMEWQQAKVVQSVNALLDRHRGPRTDDLFVTLTLFSDATRVRTLFKNRPIEEVKPIRGSEYRPDGSTALRDGLLESMKASEKIGGKRDRMLVVLVTDGGENASIQIKRDALLRLIHDRHARGNWTFVLLYLGDDASAKWVRDEIGFPDAGNYATAADILGGLDKVDTALTKYRESEDLQTGKFYNPPQKYKRPNWASTPAVVTTDD